MAIIDVGGSQRTVIKLWPGADEAFREAMETQPERWWQLARAYWRTARASWKIEPPGLHVVRQGRKDQTMLDVTYAEIPTTFLTNTRHAIRLLLKAIIYFGLNGTSHGTEMESLLHEDDLWLLAEEAGVLDLLAEREWIVAAITEPALASDLDMVRTEVSVTGKQSFNVVDLVLPEADDLFRVLAERFCEAFSLCDDE